MPSLLTEAATEARLILQDTVSPYRYPTADLLVYARDGVATFFRVRPDLRIGLTWTTSDTTVPVSLQEGYWSLLVEYIAAKAEMRDDQSMTDTRVVALLRKVQSGVLGLGI